MRVAAVGIRREFKNGTAARGIGKALVSSYPAKPSCAVHNPGGTDDHAAIRPCSVTSALETINLLVPPTPAGGRRQFKHGPTTEAAKPTPNGASFIGCAVDVASGINRHRRHRTGSIVFHPPKLVDDAVPQLWRHFKYRTDGADCRRTKKFACGDGYSCLGNRSLSAQK